MTITKVAGIDGHIGSTGWVDDSYTYKPLLPIPLQDDAHYLRGYEPGTYAYFTVSEQIKRAKVAYQDDLKVYNKWLESEKDPEGTAEKKAAIKPLIKEFAELEGYLVERGAKTFKELYPDIDTEQVPGPNYYGFYQEHPKPWNPNLTFDLPGLTDEQREAYLKLFEACWEGNLSIIKELTLTIWGNNQAPLKIAVLDSDNLSPFSIAVLRKHCSVARAILEIALAQHAPEETPLARRTIQQADEDDGSTDGGQDGIQIYSEILDDHFTVENIGEVQGQVQSTVKPLDMINWNCPASKFILDDSTSQTRQLSSLNLSDSVKSQKERQYQATIPRNLVQFAIYSDDSSLLEFLISTCEEYTQSTPSDSNEANSEFFVFPEADFLYALRLGRVQLLEMIIKRTGAGFPLNDLIERSGIEIPVKPKYYQGLSVHGKKRADWANAGRAAPCKTPDMRHPPLLWAAFFGNLQSVEWFLGDAPLHCYLQFAADHREDVRIQNLAKVKGGLETPIARWLGLHSHLLLHCVVLSQKGEDSLLMLQRLCKTHPEALEKRSESGMTPLHLAFALHRVEMVKTLLEAGADQTTRSNDGNNIIHSMLESYSAQNIDCGVIRELLGLIDRRLLPSLFLERTQVTPGAATPLARWIHVHAQSWERRTDRKENEMMVELLLEFSKGEDLGVINGDGDTPVHAVVRYHADTLLRMMLACRPEIVFYENASGRTPLEIAEDSYLSEDVFSNPPSLSPLARTGGRMRLGAPAYTRGNVTGILGRDPNSFIEEAEEGDSGIAKVLQVCRDFAANQSKGHKRRLVSLVEANEVARRLAARRTGESDAGDFMCGEEGEEEDGKEEDKEKYAGSDEVTTWFNWNLR